MGNGEASKAKGPLLTFKEAGEIAGLDYRLISAAVRAGEVPSIKFGRRVYIPREAFSKLIAGGIA